MAACQSDIYSPAAAPRTRRNRVGDVNQNEGTNTIQVVGVPAFISFRLDARPRTAASPPICVVDNPFDLHMSFIGIYCLKDSYIKMNEQQTSRVNMRVIRTVLMIPPRSGVAVHFAQRLIKHSLNFHASTRPIQWRIVAFINFQCFSRHV